MLFKIGVTLVIAGVFTHSGLIWLGCVFLFARSILGQPFRRYH